MDAADRAGEPSAGVTVGSGGRAGLSGLGIDGRSISYGGGQGQGVDSSSSVVVVAAAGGRRELERGRGRPTLFLFSGAGDLARAGFLAVPTLPSASQVKPAPSPSPSPAIVQPRPRAPGRPSPLLPSGCLHMTAPALAAPGAAPAASALPKEVALVCVLSESLLVRQRWADLFGRAGIVGRIAERIAAQASGNSVGGSNVRRPNAAAPRPLHLGRLTRNRARAPSSLHLISNPPTGPAFARARRPRPDRPGSVTRLAHPVLSPAGPVLPATRAAAAGRDAVRPLLRRRRARRRGARQRRLGRRGRGTKGPGPARGHRRSTRGAFRRAARLLPAARAVPS